MVERLRRWTNFALLERLGGAIRRAWHRLRDRNPAGSDALAFAILTVVVYIALYTVDFHDTMERWFEANEFYELDELLHALTLCGIAGFIWAARRMHQLRQEVAQRKEAERHAHRLARHDTLTGLPNRRHFLEAFPRWVANLPEDGACAVFLVDLDRFKPINDLYGHGLGDKVLKAVAARLRRIVGSKGLVARLGGDEFGVLYRYQGDGGVALDMARRIVEEVPQPMHIAALEMRIGVSLGTAIYRRDTLRDDLKIPDDTSIDLLLHRADMAMYRAKSEQRGAYRCFDDDMDKRLQQRFALEADIRGAINSGQIVPYYQPLVHLRTRRIVGYEILARWQHPERGVLTADNFIPIAERTGLIGGLTYALLRKAIADIEAVPGAPFLSVNLSPHQFADGLLAPTLRDILTGAGFPPARLQVEITETAMVTRIDEARATLAELHALGISVALDDFGTGYSGLSHLRELRLDALKIDRSYIARILENPEELRLVEAMIRLGRALDLKTTAEGIESEALADTLAALGCDLGQGFLFGPASPHLPALTGGLEVMEEKARHIA
ncbi:Cyclic di-GMP phosphodiesterase Gmr [Methyloligella halotolerans]|uniref:Cyclic di-GMP phosphodiesterase Gmr n=1 Tax=Methyloligella halotolerans TaxID=1177755 RepID=A0A1E2S0G5_9HYPH|nr:EAL domain-containing protein [Methyloligella halotolerans]ODA67815.1 Cyclic di-GMP phosphodiesterase Gmr [Methyloligella halotolerans]